MRRSLAVVVTVAALLAAGCGREQAAAPAEGGGSTLRATFADPDGDGFLNAAPGEPLLPRGESPAPRAGRTLATFAQLTDLHVRDEESPARVPFLDRLGTPYGSTFRPQEAFSTQVLDASVRAVDAEHPQAVFVTGDIVDNAQANEFDQAIDTLDGRRVDPDSGAPGYDGVQDPTEADPFYYRPDLDAPRHPGVLDAAQRPFQARGLDAPWYPAVGNHDVLAQGEVPPTPAIDAVATGDRLVSSLDPSLRPAEGRSDPAAAVADVLARGTVEDPRHSQRVPADPARRLLDPTQVVARLRAAGARGTATHAGRLEYAVDVGADVRAIVLDSVERARDGGDVSAAQLAWLREQLAAAGQRWVLVFTHVPLDRSTGGAAVLSVLDADPHVVAAVSGDRHRNVVTRHGHLWLVGTSSLTDFPQQARMFRLRAAAGGGAVLETWMVDQDGRGLAGVSRELAYLDAQGGRPQGLAGSREDRNVALAVGRPFER